VLHHRYNFATCGGGVKNRIGIFNKINETVYEFVACKEERLSYFIYVDKNVKRNRWTMGPNLNEQNRLQHTGSRANALCPNNIVSWFSLCETYTHSLAGFENFGREFQKQYFSFFVLFFSEFWRIKQKMSKKFIFFVLFFETLAKNPKKIQKIYFFLFFFF